ncbi:hypothetical protein KAZ66_03970 [Candidatus Woesebacteria bacterium]|nr:hypothetical protein [Candidatus Woesebacteria bacterium]
MPVVLPSDIHAGISRHHEKTNTVLTKPFSISGTSENIVLNDIHCGFLPEGCKVSFSGKAMVSTGEKATYTANATIDWGHSYANGKSGYCAAVTADGTLYMDTLKKACDVNSLFFTVKGTTCDESVSNELGIHIYDGTVEITGGTGTYKNAKGTAVMNGKDNLNERNGMFEARGSIRLSSSLHEKGRAYTYPRHNFEEKSKR